MYILIPLGGIGERFKKYGYQRPKALVKIFGKPILYYLLDNLNLEKVDCVCIPYNPEYSAYRLEETLQKDYPSIVFHFIKLPHTTEGAAQTINIALKQLEDKPVLCLDGDNFYTTDIVSLWNSTNKLFTFDDFGDSPIYSYVKTEGNKITDIVEKTKISNKACTGAYGFRSSKQLLYFTEEILSKQIKQKGEYYTSTAIKEMLKTIPFENCTISVNNYHCLGTPLQLKYFYNNYPRVSIDNKQNISTQRICFDLDNTLVSYPKIPNDYTTVEPIQKNIDFLKYLKTFNHTIIIYTARRMKTHKGNVGKCLADIGKITFDTLEKFSIPYDEIYFGKPHADVYIDDLALSCYDNVEKELGYYLDKIEPRSFNTLELNSIETFKKTSSDLSGEIYYYQNIPTGLKDLFPLLIDFDTNHEWYVVEKIQGVTVSSLYVNEMLTEDMLVNIMNTIKRIHIDSSESINIYSNYAKKLKKRYQSYDYSKFENYKETYDSIVEGLTRYETEKKGKCVVIHGDTVMTNILINKFGKIKFIDMRGKVENTLTIYGDFLYDWAKLYQSLLGYDKILLGKTMSYSYESKMLECFESYFVELYSDAYLSDLKIIVKSLLFSLIPLHDNDLCVEYYALIKKLK
jgi:capsule biosynthesis phosphatase